MAARYNTETARLPAHAAEQTVPQSEGIWSFLKARKKYWLLPLVIIAVVLAGLAALAASSAFSPSAYRSF